jgi:tetratricopeptide (TPR) repeat protein
VDFRYTAFISYSHADEAWARWLQRRLERYRVPSRLSARQSGTARLAPMPRRLHPVFRDRDELASSNDLGKAVETALGQSAFLIVVCSPAAARSRWVNEEISRFRQAGNDGRILCLLVDGDPERTSDLCAFPPALLTNTDGSAAPEPLAADVRKQGDGPKVALLKIVAGMLEVGIDDLRQREVQRQVRRWAALAALSAAVAAVTVGLAIAAMAAREEAQMRRGQAESLIGFMLGDLRGRLEPIGRLDLLDAVGDEAMKYYAELGEQATPTETLKRAIALRQIGEVRFAQGRFDSALTAFAESRSQAELLNRLDPSNDDHLFELGQAEFWVGYVQYERAELDAAAQSMERYLGISLELLERQPDNPDFTLELSYALSNIGTIERERGNASAALDHFAKAVAINEELLLAAPDDTSLLFDLGEGHSWMGSIRQDLGQLEASEAAFRRSLDIWTGLAQQGLDARHAEKAADGALLLADALLLQGERVAAIELQRRAVEVFARLQRDDPENARYARGHYKALCNLADVLRQEGWGAEPVELLLGGAQGLEALAEREPGSVLIGESLAQARRLDALRLLAQGDAGSALDRIEAARGWVEAQAGEGSFRLRTVSSAVRIGETHGQVLAGLGRDDAANAARSATLERWLAGEPTQPVHLAVKARLLRQLGRPDEASREIKRLQAMRFAHPEFQDLLPQ